jgi:hypothetical protein
MRSVVDSLAREYDAALSRIAALSPTFTAPCSTAK